MECNHAAGGGRLLGCHVYVYLVVIKKRSFVTTGFVAQAFTTTILCAGNSE